MFKLLLTLHFDSMCRRKGLCLALLLVSAAGNAFTGHLLSLVGREIGHGSCTFYEIAQSRGQAIALYPTGKEQLTDLKK